MKCVKCGVENRETARFCKECGAELIGRTGTYGSIETDQTVLLQETKESDEGTQEQTVLLDVNEPAAQGKTASEAGNAVPNTVPKNPMQTSKPASMATICPSCGAAVSPGALFCRKCGCNLQEAANRMMEEETAFAADEVSMKNVTAGAVPEMNERASNDGWRESVTSYAQTQNSMPNGGFAVPGSIELTEDQLPEKFRPLGAWAYFGWTLLFSIPIAGIIVAIVFSVKKDGNVNLRNFARSMFCVFVIIGIILLLMIGTAGCTMAGLML